jgi:hypothetical protein
MLSTQTSQSQVSRHSTGHPSSKSTSGSIPTFTRVPVSTWAPSASASGIGLGIGFVSGRGFVSGVALGSVAGPGGLPVRASAAFSNGLLTGASPHIHGRCPGLSFAPLAVARPRRTGRTQGA